MIENIDEIKKQLDPEQVLRFIGYHKSDPGISGGHVRDYCPIHFGDNQKSLAINIATKLGNCHSCEFEGSLIDLYALSTNRDPKEDFVECITELADSQNIAIRYQGAVRTSLPNYKHRQTINESKPIITQKPKLTPTELEQVFDRASVEGKHQYLEYKCVEAVPGLRYGKYGNYENGHDSIVVPLCDVDGNLRSIQYIWASGGSGKRYLLNSSPTGAFFIIGSFKDGDIVYFAEGLATALTIWMALSKSVPVISFCCANNMTHTINELKGKYPNIKPIACLDSNEKAFEQAHKINPAYGCSFRIPSFEGLTNYDPKGKLADFNDLVSRCKQPLTVVRDQLMQEKQITDLPISKKEEAIAGATKAPAMPSSLNAECQEELLSYFFYQPFENIIKDGFNPETLESHIFTDSNRLAFVGIINTWQKGLTVSATEAALNSGSSSKEVYDTLKRIERRSVITAEQAAKRLQMLNEEHSNRLLKSTFAEAQASQKPPHEIIDIVRSKLDDMQGGFETMLPQTHYLHQIKEDINNPKHKPLATGIASLDRLIGGGFLKTELGILSGGAGAGKSAFALQIADNVAENGGIVIYISVEIGITKLTERSFKRLSYVPNAKNTLTLDSVIEKYSTFAGNIYLRKGRHGMLVSEIRGMVLSVMRQHPEKDILLIIDPFQRLGTGHEKIDQTNETGKVNLLSSQIKEMAESLCIPILALADTTKDHKNNRSGEGSIRGSYMSDHTADYTMMLRTSRDPLKAIYGDKFEEKELEAEDPFFKNIKTKLEATAFKGRYKLAEGSWDKYASLVTSKVRDSAKFSPLFIYRPGYHLFEDIKLWENILPNEKRLW